MPRKRKQLDQALSATEEEPQIKIRKLDSPTPTISWERFNDKDARRRYKRASVRTVEEKAAYKEWQRRSREGEVAEPGDDMNGTSSAAQEPNAVAEKESEKDADAEDKSELSMRQKIEEVPARSESRKKKKREKDKKAEILDEQDGDGVEGDVGPTIEREMDVVEPETSNGRRKKKRRKSNSATDEEGALQSSKDGDAINGFQSGSNAVTSILEDDSDLEWPGDHSDSDSSLGQQVVMRQEWSVSEATGGRMLDVDPIFSPNEEYMLIAYQTHVAVYATATSLPVRKLTPQQGSSIQAFTLSSNPDHLLMGTSDGRIELWDWLAPQRLERWKIHHGLHVLQFAKGTLEDGIHVLTGHTDGQAETWQVNMHQLRVGIEKSRPNHVYTNGEKSKDTHVFSSINRLSFLRSYDDGRYIMMAAGYQLIFGVQKEDKYTWHIVKTPEWISAFDVKQSQSKGKKNRMKVAFDVAIGGMKGAIHTYENILTKLMAGQEVTSRKLHWHRNAVMALKWSLDGSYIISGGQESTMVIWQLDSGRKDFLPHLGAPIENIVVSPTGSSYALHVADNSVMILSTADMSPTFSVAGIQTPSTGKHHLPSLITADLLSKPAKSERTVAPTCVCPGKPGQILLAVPAYSSFRTSTPNTFSSPYLQTIEIESGSQLYKQAIARTNVTVMNMGPGGNMIEEPNVTHLACSQDGKWLATVDEWVPPKTDNTNLAFDEGQEMHEQSRRREVYLKFWSWSTDTKLWQLVSRIDKPHTLEYQRAARIVALSSNPHSNNFTTLSENGVLKSWSPHTRTRNNLPVQTPSGPLVNWKCSYSISLPTATPVGHLAFSADASVLALGTPSSPLIHLINALDGTIESTLPGLFTPPLLSLAILGRHLILLSSTLQVYDLVSATHVSSISLPFPSPAPLHLLKRYCHLAVCEKDNTFAATIPARSAEKDLFGARIAVFRPNSTDSLLIKELKNSVTALLPAEPGPGFYALDSGAGVQTVALTTPTPPKMREKSKKELAESKAKAGAELESKAKVEPRKEDNLLALFGSAPAAESTAKDAVLDGLADEDDWFVNRHITREQWSRAWEPDPVTRIYPPVEVTFARTMQLILGRKKPGKA